jgi:hypothetical protein
MKSILPLRYRVDDFEGRAQPLRGRAHQRTLHRCHIKGDRRNAGCVSGCLPYQTFGGTRWSKKHGAIGFPVLHVGQDGAGHLGLDAREVGARSRESLLDLIHEDNDARRIDAGEHGL